MITIQYCWGCGKAHQTPDAFICCGRATSLHFMCSSEEEYQASMPSVEMAEMVTISWPCGKPQSCSDSDRMPRQPLWYVLDLAISHPIEVRHVDGRRYTIAAASGCNYGPGEAWDIPAHHPAMAA